MPAGHAVLIHDNTPPAKVRLRPYYREPQWRLLGGWLLGALGGRRGASLGGRWP